MPHVEIRSPRRAEPTRDPRPALLLLDDQPVGSIVDSLDIGQPTVSKHLKALREAGLVTTRIDANRRIYSLRPQPLSEVDGWLLPYRQCWAARLDALEHLLDDTDLAADLAPTPTDTSRRTLLSCS